MWVPQNGWFIWENPIKMVDLGLPPFMETRIDLDILDLLDESQVDKTYSL